MRPFLTSMPFIHPRDEVVRYAGPIEKLDDETLRNTLEALAFLKPLTTLRTQGSVIRDAEDTFEWAKWHCRLQQRRFDKDDINCRLVLRLITDAGEKGANFIFRMEPFEGEGSVSYRTGVRRVAQDDYVCFEGYLTSAMGRKRTVRYA